VPIRPGASRAERAETARTFLNPTAVRERLIPQMNDDTADVHVGDGVAVYLHNLAATPDGQPEMVVSTVHHRTTDVWVNQHRALQIGNVTADMTVVALPYSVDLGLLDGLPSYILQRLVIEPGDANGRGGLWVDGMSLSAEEYVERLPVLEERTWYFRKSTKRPIVILGGHGNLKEFAIDLSRFAHVVWVVRGERGRVESWTLVRDGGRKVKGDWIGRRAVRVSGVDAGRLTGCVRSAVAVV
jgi:hypothetical protein